MKTFLIYAVFMIIGLFIALGLYMTAGFAFLSYLQNQGGHPPESYLGIAFMAVFPVCLAMGSLVAGYLSRPYVRNSFTYIFLSPGIYAAIYVILTSGGTIPGYLQYMLLCSTVWILTSIIAVYIGQYLRSKRSDKHACKISQ